jgi:hypothetical protein
MPAFNDFDQFARELERVAVALPKEIEHALRDTGVAAVKRAKAKIGVYQEEFTTPEGKEFEAWEPLHYSTLYGGQSASGFYFAGKIELGYASEGQDNPLLREGDLRDSISFSLGGTTKVTSVTLGSDSQVMVWQEVGTIIISPRSVIGAAMAETVQEDHLGRIREAVERAFGRM